MFTQKSRTLFIVDDNETYARSLQAAIRSHFPGIYAIKTFSIGETCLLELHRNPEIVIVDYYLNTKFPSAHNGLETIKQINAQKPQTKTILLTSLANVNFNSEAIKQYNSSYVEKDAEGFNHVVKLIKEIIISKNSNALELWG